MDERILKLLSKNARLTAQEIAVRLGMAPEEVSQKIAEMEKAGILRGYKAVVDWEKVDPSTVSAIIELKVTPKAGCGFEEVAERVAAYPEVESVYLMSGVYDLRVVVRGKTFQQVAMFVAKELSTIDSVVETATYFVLRRYKELDVPLHGHNTDDRGTFLL